MAELPTSSSQNQSQKIKGAKYPFGNLVTGLVIFRVGTWREVMDMDIEDAINTFMILYIQRYNENLAYESSRK